MLRERREVIFFSRDDLEKILRNVAQMQIVGSMFIGRFGEQVVRWDENGNAEVITSYHQGDLSDLPLPQQAELPRRLARGKSRK
jgi:hypothetical protein